MAGNNRDVRLGVGVEVTGEEQIQRLAHELNGLTAATAEARTNEAAARSEQAAATKARNEAGDALARWRIENDKATRSSEEGQAREKALKQTLLDKNVALRESAAAVTAAANASRAAVTAENEQKAALDRATAAQRANTAAMREQAGAAGEALTAIRGQFSALQNIAGLALSGSIVGSLAKDLADVADGYANLSARVKIVTPDAAAAAAALQGVFDVAKRTGVSVEEVGALFTKLSQAGKELNLTSADALRLAESVSQATQLSGASAQEAAASVTQFAQAIASGRLQGDELKSILENSPRLARALAEGLGVAVGQLKDLGAAGSLTAAQVVAALQGQSAALQSEFDRLPLTVGRSITNLGTAWTEYIGKTDQASGASHTAAEAIGALARNLDTVAGVLYSAGKAAAALAAVKLAGALWETAAALAGSTVATTANTAATAANTAARTANAAAAVAGAEATAASAGRLASIIGGIKLFSLVGVLTNLREIGTGIGEFIAKAMGAGKSIEDLERATKADEAASRANASAKAALAQATQLASDKALGLGKESKALVAEFDGLVLKGESAADALGKLGKSLDLSDVRGIGIASAALDALAVKGKITGEQVRNALAAALSHEDLARFETQARATFDGSEQGARRLQAALDAIADESLKRAGTSAHELATGFSEAATSAINNVDILGRTLDSLGVRGGEASRALAAALDKATAAAGTERAVQAVIDRFTALGVAGKLAGDQLAGGLDKARAKLDALRPGIDSLGEALRLFGLKTRQELQATADKLGAAYRMLANDVSVSLADKAAAFKKYAEAATAANGGVESSEVQLQRAMLQTKLDASGLGDAIVGAMDRAAGATDRATTAQDRYNRALQADPSRLVSGSSGLGTLGLGGSTNKPSPARPSGETRTAGGQYTPPDDSGTWELSPEGVEFANSHPTATNATMLRYWVKKDGSSQVRPTPGPSTDPGGVNGSAGYSPFGSYARMQPPVPSPAPAPAKPSSVVEVRLLVGGQTIPVRATPANADALLAALQAAQRASGG